MGFSYRFSHSKLTIYRFHEEHQQHRERRPTYAISSILLIDIPIDDLIIYLCDAGYIYDKFTDFIFT